MKKPLRKRKCRHCHTFFLPDPRNTKRQKYCKNPERRKVSKAESQRKWLAKPENQNYFKGADHVKRVQKWRKEHPGYWRRKTSRPENALQEPLIEKNKENHKVTSSLGQSASQDSLFLQPSVFVGIIAQLKGNTLQDDIASCVRNLQQLGDDILNNPNCQKGGKYVSKMPPSSRAGTQNSKSVQLGGSPVRS